MKRKIIAASLIACMVLVAVTSATLAYFTDKDALKNEFTIGAVDIDLWEIVDADGTIVGKDTDQKDSHTYGQLFPGDTIRKEVVIENKTSYDTYVRVTVVMNNVSAIDEAIDGVYEDKEYDAEKIQAVYNEVFNGWGINYSKREANSTRLWMTERESGCVLFDGQIDLITKHTDEYCRVDMKNTFMTDKERAKFVPDGQHDGILDIRQNDPKSYYWEAVNAGERAYVFYLKLDGVGKTDDDGNPTGTTQYTLFNGLRVPADFTQEQAAMFNGLKIDVYADAIQVEGFADAKEAFDALNETLPIGHWNAK